MYEAYDKRVNDWVVDPAPREWKQAYGHQMAAVVNPMLDM